METDELYWDPYDARFVDDPWPVFNRIREEAPLYYNQPHDFYALSRYADVERAVTDTATFSSAQGTTVPAHGLHLLPEDIDPPLHHLAHCPDCRLAGDRQHRGPRH